MPITAHTVKVRHPMIQNIGLYAYQYNLNEVLQKTSYWNQNVVEMLLIPTKYWTVTRNLTVTLHKVTSPQIIWPQIW